MTKGIVMAACLLAATIVPAAAADPDWQGFYVGAQVGYGSMESSWSDIDYDWYGGTLTNSDEGVTYGLTAGYNFSNGPMVYGIEADYSFGSIKNEIPYEDGFVAITDEFKYLATIRARAGVVAGNSLLYFTAGVALPSVEHTWTETNDVPDSWPTFSNSSMGLVAGVGVEHRFNGRFSFKGEYIFLKTGEESSTNPNDYEMRLTDKLNTLRLGLNWHF